jgi:hypothetical protein
MAVTDIGKPVPDTGEGIPDIGKAVPDTGEGIPDTRMVVRTTSTVEIGLG